MAASKYCMLAILNGQPFLLFLETFLEKINWLKVFHYKNKNVPANLKVSSNGP